MLKFGIAYRSMLVAWSGMTWKRCLENYVPHYWLAILPWDHRHPIWFLALCGSRPDGSSLEGMHAAVRALCSHWHHDDNGTLRSSLTEAMGGQMIHISPTALACVGATQGGTYYYYQLHTIPRCI